MAGLETGMVCIKTKGKEAGRKAVIVELGKNAEHAIIEGPFVKKRKCNIKHLLPTGKRIELKKKASKKEIAELLEKVK